MRVLLDTNVLVSAITRRDGPARELTRLMTGPHVLVTSAFLLSELQRVLAYPRVRSQTNATPRFANWSTVSTLRPN